jgi:restriction system protein
MPKTIFDYLDYVELVGHGKDISDFDPTPNEVIRTAAKYIKMDRLPDDFFRLATTFSQSFWIDMWSYYSASKRSIFEECGLYKMCCPYCGTRLNQIKNPRFYSNCDYLCVLVKECKICGWWQTHENYLSNAGDRLNQHMVGIYKTALLKQFEVDGIETPIRLLKEYFIKHPNKLHLISSQKMELLVTDIFKDFFKGDAIHLGGPNDKGIDVIVYTGDVQYAVQVKRRLDVNTAEPVNAIRDFIGAMVIGNYTKGLYVTSANKFSKPSKDAVKQAKKHSHIEFIELYNGQRLADICRQTIRREPKWKSFASTKDSIKKSVSTGAITFMFLAEKYKKMNTQGSLEILLSFIHDAEACSQLGVSKKLRSNVIRNLKKFKPDMK